MCLFQPRWPRTITLIDPRARPTRAARIRWTTQALRWRYTCSDREFPQTRRGVGPRGARSTRKRKQQTAAGTHVRSSLWSVISKVFPHRLLKRGMTVKVWIWLPQSSLTNKLPSRRYAVARSIGNNIAEMLCKTRLRVRNAILAGSVGDHVPTIFGTRKAR